MSEDPKSDMDIFAELAKVTSQPKTLRIETEEVEAKEEEADSLLQEGEGQLTIDVFQDEDNIYVQSAVAGVKPEDLEINIAKEAVTIRGKRERMHKVSEKNFFYQECFWGRFSRSVVLPQEVDPDRSGAALKNGILTITMPKIERKRTKSLKIKAG